MNTLIRHFIAYFLLFLCSVSYAEVNPTDTGWPKNFAEGNNQLIVYQPQIDDWKDNLVLSGKVAVEVIPAGATTMTGVLWFSAETVVNKENHMVLIHNLTVTKSAFFETDPTKEALAASTAMKLIPNKPITISLDRLLAQIENAKKTTADIPVNNDPPQIFVSLDDAQLVLFDGEPLWHEITGTNLTFAVNTNWNIFFLPSTKTYYLLDNGFWFESLDLMASTWKNVDNLPDDFNKIPKDDNWQEVHAALPLKANHSQPIKWFVSTKPAELIVIKGEPELRSIPNTTLSQVNNTESDLFFEESDKNYYYLVAGRWFKSSSLNGPWVYTTPNLPADFSKIPETDSASRVLASVPGTTIANNAVQIAQIPQLATVKKSELSLSVVYTGDPQFQSIPGTSLQYAVNTNTIVIKVKDHYYALSNGVWFESNSPKGPWVVAEKVASEIYQIPPSSPVYNATYVKIYGVNQATNEVTVGYTDGYMGVVISGGIVVFGTGYYYPPYYFMLRPYYPIYYPCFHTYGMNVYYSPYYGVFYRHGYAYGPYGGINGVAVYNPATGGYYRGVSAYGPYQAGRAFVAYNPTTGVHAAGYQRFTPYASWGRGVVSQGDKWARGGYYSGPQVKAGHYQTSGGSSGGAAKIKGGDLYVGKDGNVYRKQGDQWYHWQDGGWTPLLGKQGEQNLGAKDKGAYQGELQNRHAGDTLSSQDNRSQLQQRRGDAQTLSTQPGSDNRLHDLNHESNIRMRGDTNTTNYQKWHSAGQNPRLLSGSQTPRKAEGNTRRH